MESERMWITSILGVLILGGAFIIARWLMTRADAAAVWQARSDEDPDMQRLGEERFGKVYMRVHGPRAPIFFIGGCLTMMLALPITFQLAERLFEFYWAAEGNVPELGPGRGPWLFIITILVIALSVGIGAVFARIFHHNQPVSLEHEIDKELGHSE